jgi:hypothetical protein
LVAAHRRLRDDLEALMRLVDGRMTPAAIAQWADAHHHITALELHLRQEPTPRSRAFRVVTGGRAGPPLLGSS